ncbi:MAG TPA: PQQ-dependent sugar dehydrogenase [Kofleriaceae bacterium]|nr:PQQ-dependent sugar dehydrogenase [Kofleriaceae bacterium]
MRGGRVLGWLAVALVGAGAGAACEQKRPAAQEAPRGRGVETGPPNAPDQRPAFEGQTRAPVRTAGVVFDVQTIARRLDHPWGLAFLPDGQLLITERPGRMRLLDAARKPATVAGLPAVDARDQGGLLDVAIDPDFARNRLVYWSYAEPRAGGNGTAVARGRLVAGPPPRLDGVEVIWRQTPTLDSTKHFGSRLVFAPDGTLFITTGERSILAGRRQAERLDGTLGKIVRIKADGTIPDDNPFVGRPGAKPEIWSYGHRNIQGAALHPRTGALWVAEHGPKGGDELNLIERGKDYGWPTITYGVEYSGEPVGAGRTAQAGLEQPRYYWDPVIAPSGLAFYDADLVPAWRDSVFIGGLVSRGLVRLTLDGDQVVGEERLLEDRGERIRDVRVGPDGALYVLTDADDGELLRLVPSPGRPR